MDMASFEALVLRREIDYAFPMWGVPNLEYRLRKDAQIA
jgi:hypothetical protein